MKVNAEEKRCEDYEGSFEIDRIVEDEFRRSLETGVNVSLNVDKGLIIVGNRTYEIKPNFSGDTDFLVEGPCKFTDFDIEDEFVEFEKVLPSNNLNDCVLENEAELQVSTKFDSMKSNKVDLDTLKMKFIQYLTETVSSDITSLNSTPIKKRKLDLSSPKCKLKRTSRLEDEISFSAGENDNDSIEDFCEC